MYTYINKFYQSESLSVLSPAFGSPYVIETLVGRVTFPEAKGQSRSSFQPAPNLDTWLRYFSYIGQQWWHVHLTVTLSLFCIPEPGLQKVLTKCV